MSLYIDLSEFLAVPMKTGIQRIGGELCRYFPKGVAIPVRLHSNRLLALPPTLIEVVGEFFRNSGESALEDIRRLGSPDQGRPITVAEGDRMIVPEIFGAERAAFFRQMAPTELQRCHFIVYDLLPLTHPEFFPPSMSVDMAPYYHIVRNADTCGFISEHTRNVYYTRLKRTGDYRGVVLPLGSDVLGPRVQRPALNRPLSFSVLGTVEPRKNPALVLEAFEPLLRQIDGLTLSFIGKMGWVEPRFAEQVHALASDPKSGFRFFSAPNDAAIRSHIEQSRATIYVSAAEGYGLPPVESLWVGTPVIASKAIPSLDVLGSAGIHFVEPLNVVNLRRAVLAFVDNAYANQKIQETINLQLPTWETFTHEVLNWCSN